MNTKEKPYFDYHTLIISLLKGQASDSEVENISEWIEESAENKELFMKLKLSWMSSAQINHLDSEVVEKALTKVKSRMSSSYINAGSRGSYQLGRFVRIAAIVLIAVLFSSLGTYYLMNAKSGNENINNEKYTYVYSPMGSKAMTVLPDGTKIWLNAGSNLKYDVKTYGQSDREVTLIGEAFFHVISNAEKPFVVNAKDLKIKALGTEFNVKAYPEENKISTTLVKGIVKIEREDQADKTFSITLKPNQQFVMPAGKATVNEKVVKDPDKLDTKDLKDIKIQNVPRNSKEKPKVVNLNNTVSYTSWKDSRWVINGKDLGELATLLERRFNVKIEFKSEELKNYRFTGIFENETLEQVLQILRLTAPLKYNIEKGEVTLYLDPESKSRYSKYLNTQ